MARYVRVDDDNSGGGGCLLAAIFGLIILAVIIYLAIVALAIILGIILIVSALLGIVLTLRNFFSALRDSLAICAGISKPNGWIIPNFVYKFFKIGWETVKALWRQNISDMKNFFGNLGLYRVFGFKFWLNLFSGISLLVFGTIATWVLYLFYNWVLMTIVLLAFLGLVLITTVFALIGLGVAVAISVTNYISRFSESVSGYGFFDYVTQGGYSECFGVLGNYWSENVFSMKDRFADFGSFPLISFKKWLSLGIGLMLAVVGTLLLAVFGVIHILLLSLLFIVMKPISLIRH